MSLIDLKVKHGRTFDDAKAQLSRTVLDLKSRFGILIQKVAWSPQGDQVTLAGPGVKLDLSVDPDDVHVKGDMPMLGGLVGPASNLKAMVEKAFQRRLQ